MNCKSFVVVCADNGAILAPSLDFAADHLAPLGRVTGYYVLDNLTDAEIAVSSHLKELGWDVPPSISIGDMIVFRSEEVPETTGGDESCYLVITRTGCMLAPDLKFVLQNHHRLHGRHLFTRFDDLEEAKEMAWEYLTILGRQGVELPYDISLGDIFTAEPPSPDHEDASKPDLVSV